MTQATALAILKTGANIFLTGEPGAGKTHTINEYVAYLRTHGIEPTVTASTGIAATHIHGTTIHSWSGIGIRRSLSPYEVETIATTEYINKRIRATRVLIIDEISMLDAGTLDMVDMVCRAVRQSEDPFGGIQVVLVGDFFQLPPVTKGENAHFAFESRVWQHMKPLICYLLEQHRQEDNDYLEVLSAIRTNTFDVLHQERIEARRIDADSAQAHVNTTTRLFSHNTDVDSINDLELAKLSGLPARYSMTSKGKPSLVEGLKKGCLSPEVLILKVGAAIMCTKNNKDKGYVNGTTGTVVAFETGTHYPIIETKQKDRIVVEPAEWQVEENGKVKASITQIPLRLAWAITIHKSQGLSLDSALMDLSQVFEYGQGYVALSRVRSLSGLYILGWNAQAFRVHPYILERDSSFRGASRSVDAYFSDMPSSELETLHHNFILASGGVLDIVKKKPRVKGDTLEETLILVLKETPLKKIAKERGLTVTTILSHIEKLVMAKRLERADIEYLIEEKTFANLSDIHTTFQTYDTSKLTPIYDHYKGRFSYEQLRLARMIR